MKYQSNKYYAPFHRKYHFLPKRKAQWILVIAICTLVAIFLWDIVCPKYYCLRYRGTKYVLFWDDLYLEDDNFVYDQVGYDLFEGCEFSKCFASVNRDVVPVEDFDAIIFHGGLYSSEEYNFPAKRKSNQKYIYYNLNAPIISARNKRKHFNNVFNWTMTYRLDSDISIPYGKKIFRYDTNNDLPEANVSMVNKSKLMAWMPSDCSSLSPTKRQYQYLINYFPIDVYGECGKFTCSSVSLDPNVNCAKIFTTYKFVFVPEEVFCRDYISKLVWQVLSKADNAVPVVYGGARYKDILPPGSYVDVQDFQSITDLAKYLIKLNGNDEEYMKYFKWKEYFRIERVNLPCKLCKKLHIAENFVSYYNDIEKWWLGDSQSGFYCKRT